MDGNVDTEGGFGRKHKSVVFIRTKICSQVNNVYDNSQASENTVESVLS